MGFSRQEYWSGLPFPSPGNLPDPGMEPGLPHCRQMLYHLSHQGSPNLTTVACKLFALENTFYITVHQTYINI